MRDRSHQLWRGILAAGGFPFSGPSQCPVRQTDNSLVTRRGFLRSAAGTAGLAVGSSMLLPGLARADHRAAPRPIPGGVTVVIGDESFPIHHFPPAHGNEPSQITDFRGDVGNCRILGTGTGTDLNTREESSLLFQADQGFMQAEYVGEDGRRHHGTFQFI